MVGRQRVLAGVVVACVAAGCGSPAPASGDAASAPATAAVQTLTPGVITIAITGHATGELDPEAWMNRYAERLAADLWLKAEWKVAPFDKS